jgi:Tat protein secretion system quality control protein TatD with DNase activity
VEHIYQQGAKLKKVSEEDLKKAVWENFNRIENQLISRF